jgi:hypothetical protein
VRCAFHFKSSVGDKFRNNLSKLSFNLRLDSLVLSNGFKNMGILAFNVSKVKAFKFG